MQPSLRLVLWNVEWATATSTRGRTIRHILRDQCPDLICLTEASESLLPDGGHTIASDPDFGYPLLPGRRKVLLWSRWPWHDVDIIGSPALPSGRFVRGTTGTSLCSVTVFGLCIPWRDAHVATGRRDRSIWQDHRAYLAALQPLIAEHPGTRIVTGDWNQRLPRHGQPADCHQALLHAVSGLQLATAGPIAPIDKPSIDHVAHTPDLKCTSIHAWPGKDHQHYLSDHFGLAIDFTTA